MRQTIITLIHGTWSPNATWVKDNSDFRKDLGGKLGVDHDCFKPFKWSGLNQVRCRAKACDRLVVGLKGQFAEERAKGLEVDHYLIAHSHGGNIAMYAMRDPEVDRGVRGIVCLSTPFLHAQDRPLPAWIIYTAQVLGALGLGGLGFLALRLCPAQVVGTGAHDLVRSHALAVWFVLAIISYFLYSTSRAAQALKGRLLLPVVSADKLLIVRGTGDEASGALTTASFVNWALNKVLLSPSNVSRSVCALAGFLLRDVTRSVLAWLKGTSKWMLSLAAVFALAFLIIPSTITEVIAMVFLAITLIAILLYFVMGYFARAAMVLDCLVVVVAWIVAFVVAVALFAIVPPFMLALLWAFGGFSLAPAVLRLEMTAEACPAGGLSEVYLLPPARLPSGDGGTFFSSHCGIYDNKEAIRIVADWINSKRYAR